MNEAAEFATTAAPELVSSERGATVIYNTFESELHGYYQHGEEITQVWNATFIVMAFFVAFVSAFSSVRLLDHTLWRCEKQQEHASGFVIKYPRALVAWILGGGTIWSMHFTGMSAVTLKGNTPMCYHWNYTLLSLFCAVSFTWAGVKVASYDVFAGKKRLKALKRILFHNSRASFTKHQPTATREIHKVAFFHKLHHIFAGSLLAATGALTMHYTGMQAVRGPFTVVWEWEYVGASVAVAVVVCFVGFWIVFRLLHWKVEQFWLRPAAATVLALAVCGLHFFGMLGAHYIADNDLEKQDLCSNMSKNASPNDWNHHQLVIAGVCLLVPSVGMLVEHLICRELLMAYANLKNPQLGNISRMSGSSTHDLVPGRRRRSSNKSLIAKTAKDLRGDGSRSGRSLGSKSGRSLGTADESFTNFTLKRNDHSSTNLSLGTLGTNYTMNHPNHLTEKWNNEDELISKEITAVSSTDFSVGAQSNNYNHANDASNYKNIHDMPKEISAVNTTTANASNNRLLSTSSVAEFDVEVADYNDHHEYFMSKTSSSHINDDTANSSTSNIERSSSIGNNNSISNHERSYNNNGIPKNSSRHIRKESTMSRSSSSCGYSSSFDYDSTDDDASYDPDELLAELQSRVRHSVVVQQQIEDADISEFETASCDGDLLV